MKYLAYLLLSLTIGFNLYLYYPETQILADPNDNIFQYSLVDRTNWIWQNYNCPFSLTCLPNLIDHVVPTWAEGYPLPFYYTHLPQIAIVSSYNMVIQPLSSLLSLHFTLYTYYNWTKFLLLAFLPLSFYIALRVVGFSPLLSAIGAFFASHFSTDGLYGIDPPSYLWRGYGLTSQLYAIFFLPLAISYAYKGLVEISNFKNQISNLLLAGIFLTLTTAGHLGIGIIGFISLLPFLLFNLKASHIISRMKRLALIYAIPLFLLAYWIIPALMQNNYHMISFWDPIWKFDSYGWYEVIRQFWAGELFDWQRVFPVITTIVLIGFFVCTLAKNYFPFALQFSLFFLLYFGRTSWGPLIDLIPGMKDFHQHRFLVGIQIASIFLIPIGIGFLFDLLRKSVVWISSRFTILNFPHPKRNDLPGDLSYLNIIYYIVVIIFITVINFITLQQTLDYTKLNSRWISEANTAYQQDEKNFQDLLTYLSSLPDYRIYAGRPGNWGHDFRLGSTQMYMLFGVSGKSISQFLPETWSPLSENEQNFDERVPEDYDLLNIGYVVAPKNQGFANGVSFEKKFGPFELYKAPTTGWFDVVTSPMQITSSKTNFLNIVHLWQRSYARRWKMHPLISVEKNPKTPSPLSRNLKMTDEVTYVESKRMSSRAQSRDPITTKAAYSEDKNIFSDFPFVFPDATPSGRIISEKVEKQTYSADIEIPSPCNNCMVMFKQSYHPNWEAKVDGDVATTYAVFPFYLAIPIDSGMHTVSFSYQTNNLKIVLFVLPILSIASLLIFHMIKRKYDCKNSS